MADSCLVCMWPWVQAPETMRFEREGQKEEKGVPQNKFFIQIMMLQEKKSNDKIQLLKHSQY